MALPVNKRVLKILFILFVVAFCVYFSAARCHQLLLLS